MKFKFVAPALVTTLAFSGLVASLQVLKASANEPTVFRCVNSGGDPATVAARGSKQSPPLVVWRTDYFGEQFNPQERCRIVSQKLTSAVDNNGGSLQSLQLTHGPVNGLTVICHVKGGGKCNRSNMLFTLKPQNAKKAASIVQQIKDFAAGKAGTPPVEESGTGQVYADLQEMLEPSLGSEDSSQPTEPSDGGSSGPGW